MSKPSYTVRQATPADAETLSGFVYKLLSELSDGEEPDRNIIADSARQLLPMATVTGLLAFRGSEPVGAMMLNECAAIYAGGRFAEITELYVRPEHRSFGVASQLVSAATELAGARGWKRLEVGAPHQPEWERSLKFYLREGFEEIGPRLRKRT